MLEWSSEVAGEVCQVCVVECVRERIVYPWL